VDRDKKLRVMLSDIMGTQPFANRLAKQRFATEANKIRKLVFRQGGDNFGADFSARMQDLIRSLENPGESSSGEEIRATSSTAIPVGASTSSAQPSWYPQKENEETNDAKKKDTVTREESDDERGLICEKKKKDKSSAGLRAIRAPDDTKRGDTKKATQTSGGKEDKLKTHVVAAERGASGDVRHEVDCALRKALTTFLQQAPPETRKNAAHTAQGVKKEILASLTSESIVEQCVERFLHQLAT